MLRLRRTDGRMSEPFIQCAVCGAWCEDVLKARHDRSVCHRCHFKFVKSAERDAVRYFLAAARGVSRVLCLTIEAQADLPLTQCQHPQMGGADGRCEYHDRSGSYLRHVEHSLRKERAALGMAEPEVYSLESLICVHSGQLPPSAGLLSVLA